MRSLPEKTLEHWAGLYLSSRFVRAEQWWPTQGEDVALTLRSTITSPGKVIMLEMKVPEVTATGHTLSISTDQVQRYLGRRLPCSMSCQFRTGRDRFVPGPRILPAQPAGGGGDPTLIGLVTGRTFCQLLVLLAASAR
jgi:hypothetical protein